MNTYCIKNLEEIKNLLLQLSIEQYTHNAKLLSEATIGQHTRHIIEFYQSVLKGMNTNSINYDNRKRVLSIETDKDLAIQIIDLICSELEFEIADKPIVLKGNFSTDEGNETLIKTSLYREFAYCLEHSIHHQALIKVGLLELNSLSFIDETFGLAPATIRYKRVYGR